MEVMDSLSPVISTPSTPTVEIIEENGPTVEETYEVTTTRRKTVRTSYKIQETSASTKTTTMTTAAKLYGKDLSEYDDVDVDDLLAQLSPEEINILAKEVDPDDSFMPPSQRCSYECDKDPTGPLNRKKLIDHINKQALETPDIPELKPYVPGTVRGKKWIPPPQDNQKEKEADEQIAIDLGDEYEQALSAASQEEIIDLAAILGFHSMMNQDQYHASLLNSGQPVGLGWDGITKASQPKVFPMEPPNNTDVDETIKQVHDDDHKLIDLNWNNIKNISDEKFIQLFEALEINTHLEALSLTNVGLTDKTALRLADVIEKNSTLRVLNVETNFISPSVIVRLIKALLKTKSIEEFRCSNQRSQVLGNKIEMEITQLVEQNPTLLRLGLHLEFNDARHRVAAHLQRNIDRIRRADPLERAKTVAIGAGAGNFSVLPDDALKKRT
ncbi:tropomodulin isoform X1 [Athalia rosae]|uniref:tropomodulin isoform X1 n=2 Tax=Athalia rosae TaxID=37344 RepID=UPI0020332CA2|nr:tropomodulin isoform X1 [Athalia rosae]XP_048506355.1 tropomodulin isoform X1 [Athalia rosae]XP_048506356.1 tropomodulin isoform X1 [Athalia rosae]